MKLCRKCNMTKSFNEFQKRKDSPDGYRSECKDCRLAYQRNYHKNPPKKKEPAPDGMKRCYKCEKTLEKSNFGKNKRNKDGLRSECKDCKKKESAAWREKNPTYGKEYRENNHDKLIEYGRNYNKENKEVLYEKKKVYVEKNREREADRKKNWYEKNKETIISKKHQRRQDDVQLRIAENLRMRLYHAIKRGVKNGSAIQDLGCSLDYFKEYMQDKFTDGMTWDNYGKWHIDHIMPISSFDLTNAEQVKEACHYTNLQPLWAKDNLKKGAKIPDNKK